MALQYEVPENLDNDAPFLKEEGVFHIAVIHAEEDAVYKRGEKKGQLRGGFCLDFEVLAGPQAKKTCEVFGRNPLLTHKDKGEFCAKVQGRILEAIAVTDPSHRGKTVTIELVSSDGKVVVLARQCIAKFSKNSDGYIELDGANIWHVDDPRAEQCERNQNALNLIPKGLRRDPKSFATASDAKAKSSSNSGTASGNGSTTAGQQQQQKAAAAAVDLDNL